MHRRPTFKVQTCNAAMNTCPGEWQRPHDMGKNPKQEYDPHHI